MRERIYYKEEQHFSGAWIWLILAGSFAVFFGVLLYSYYEMAFQGNTTVSMTEEEKSLLTVMGVGVIAFGLTFFLFKKMKMVIEIRTGAFYYRYPPFIRKMNRIGKEEIERYEVRQYKPIREYGGWGVRQGTGKAGKAFNVKGKVGLQLYLKNGKKVLFGTQRGDAILRAMDKMMKEE